jgi:parallel beta-helix repeat protein
MKIIKKKLTGILFCMLMIVSAIIPVSGTTLTEKASQILVIGNTLYVGGSGPNNYTKIQDAINASSNGDTVFVYDDSSPYYENIEINISISLIGEDKNTTIIDGANISDGVNITVDNVTVMGFTIQNCNGSGICLCSNYNRITDNILTENYYGIAIDLRNPSVNLSQSTGNNTITNNYIIRDGAGIFLVGEGNNTIRGNIISQTEMGIMLMAVMNKNISFNIISENEIGVWIWMSYNTILYRNNVSYNTNFGVSTIFTSADKILQNNFIGNNRSALSCQSFIYKLKVLKKGFNFPIRRNVWNGNYWDEPRSLPYKIPGLSKLKFWVDWHPAQKPYDIPYGV